MQSLCPREGEHVCACASVCDVCTCGGCCDAGLLSPVSSLINTLLPATMASLSSSSRYSVRPKRSATSQLCKPCFAVPSGSLLGMVGWVALPPWAHSPLESSGIQAHTCPFCGGPFYACPALPSSSRHLADTRMVILVLVPLIVFLQDRGSSGERTADLSSHFALKPGTEVRKM